MAVRSHPRERKSTPAGDADYPHARVIVGKVTDLAAGGASSFHRGFNRVRILKLGTREVYSRGGQSGNGNGAVQVIVEGETAAERDPGLRCASHPA